MGAARAGARVSALEAPEPTRDAEDLLTLIEKTAFLKSVDILASVPTEALLDLAENTREIHLDPGDVVFEEGEPNRGTFLVVEGVLEQRKGDALIRVIEPRMVAGELWLGENEPHNYTVRANTHAHVLQLERRDVDESITDYPEIALAIVKGLAFRLHELTERALELEEMIARLNQEVVQRGIHVPDVKVPEREDPVAPPGAPGAAVTALGTGTSLPNEPVEPPPPTPTRDKQGDERSR
jgi:CRP-like cAMP-binding protein